MSIPRTLRFQILRRDDFTCHYCGRSASEGALEVDHVTPVASGGTDDPRNLVTACIPCNQGKAATPLDPISHAVELGYYQFEATYRTLYPDSASPAQLRGLWNAHIAPYLRESMERSPVEHPALFACAIGHAEATEGTREYREGKCSTPWQSMAAFRGDSEE